MLIAKHFTNKELVVNHGRYLDNVSKFSKVTENEFMLKRRKCD